MNQWHSIPSEEVIREFNSNKDQGLGPGQAEVLLKSDGPNELPPPASRSRWVIFGSQFLSPLIYLLLCAAGIAYFIGEIRDAFVIVGVLILNAIIGAYQEGRAEQSLAALRRLSRLKARVLRSGQEQIIEAREIVKGDLLILSSGDAVPTDARLLEASRLTTAEGALTGESIPVEKGIETLPETTPLADRTNMVFAGTYVTNGRGLAVAVSVGLQNEIGKIAQLAIETQQPKTQLEIRIEKFGKVLVFASLVMFVSVILVGLWRDISFSQIFMIAISQLVSLVPEGLPVAMTIALAVGVRRMAHKKSIVRRLAAVESLGSTTIICTDKTGTLTKNEMTVTSLCLLDDSHNPKFLEVTGIGYSPTGLILEKGLPLQVSDSKSFQELLKACILCNDAQLVQNEGVPNQSTAKVGEPSWKAIGDPTESALLTLAVKGGLAIETVRAQSPRLAEIPFSSESKLMATQHFIQGSKVIYLKGAPESLLELCGYQMGYSGNRAPFTEEARKSVRNAAQDMAQAALRVLALGMAREIDKGSLHNLDENLGFTGLKGEVCFLGLVGQIDPPREEVAAAVHQCQSAGIRPVMVTGDHKATGLAIAKKLHIAKEGDQALDGIDLENLSDEELIKTVDHVSVFARVHPAQKLRIVSAFQNAGHVVAMTGDGANDAPALVQADVGVAMGITGTEVAKEAAKIVITDDNFSTLVEAVAEGRLVYQNIKKLILFLFVTSIDEVIVLFGTLLLGLPIPLLAVQILWLNIVTEGTLTLNLVMEPPEGDEMQKPPIPTDQPLLDRPLLLRVPLMVFSSVSATFGWFVYRLHQGVPIDLLRTETFTVLAICQWFNVLNCRSNLHSAFSLNLLKNPWLIGGLLLANGLQLAVVYWEPLGKFFHTVPVDPQHFLILGAVASAVLWTEEMRKFIFRRYYSKVH